MTKIAVCLSLFLLQAVAIASADKDFRRPSWQEEDDWKDSELNWKTKEALREYYVNWLLQGLRREEEEEPEAESLPLFSRHRPYKGLDTRDEPLDYEYESNFAFPPSDPRFFAPAPRPFEDPDGRMTTQSEPEDTTSVKRAELEDGPKVDKVAMGSGLKAVYDTQNMNDELPVVRRKLFDLDNNENLILIALVAGCSTGVIAALGLLVYALVRRHRNAKAAADVDYPAYGVTGPRDKESTPTGDRRLAHSAQMYHYQLTKQQIIAMESNRGERRGSISEADSDDDNEEGDYTVYECPGLAPAGEMEVKNPLFLDDPTPAAPTDSQTAPETHPTDETNAADHEN